MTRIVTKEKPYAIIYGLPLDPQVKFFSNLPKMDPLFEQMIETLDNTFMGLNLNIKFGSVRFFPLPKSSTKVAVPCTPK
jgi:hypothetical protein